MNIRFLDAISEKRSYARLVKKMLSNKMKLQENAIVFLMEECSAIIPNKLPAKLKDWEFLYSLCLGDITISRALCGFRVIVNLMHHSIYKRLQVGEFKPISYRFNLQNAP